MIADYVNYLKTSYYFESAICSLRKQDILNSEHIEINGYKIRQI